LRKQGIRTNAVFSGFSKGLQGKNDGTRQDCLVAAKEENGNWTVLTIDEETKEYPVV